MKTLYLFLFSIFFALNVQAQPKFEAGILLGLLNYQGDLVQETGPLFKEGNLGYGITGVYAYNYRLAFRTNLLFGKLTGDDYNYAERRKRGFKFQTPVTEVSVTAHYEPLGEKRYLSVNGFNKFPSPYVFGGFGLAFTNPKTDFSRYEGGSLGKRIDEDQNANYFKTRFTIPFGLGLKMDIGEYWYIGVEVGMRYAFTDYLDGVSRSGLDNKDWYSFSGITLIHRLKGTENM